MYINHLKADLKIVSEDFLNKIILVWGMLHTDESRKMTSYEWLCPVTEDWCMLKLTGKVLRNALWGGGLKTSQ